MTGWVRQEPAVWAGDEVGGDAQVGIGYSARFVADLGNGDSAAARAVHPGRPSQLHEGEQAMTHIASLVIDGHGWRVDVGANGRNEDSFRGDPVPDNDLLETAATALRRNNWLPTEPDDQYHWSAGWYCTVRWAGR